jgi:hypothetical protein
VIFRLWRLATTIGFAAVLTACASSSQTSNAYSPLFAPAGEPICIAEACQVSLVSLIANPANFAGKNVQVIGFATFEFEGNALYLSKEAAAIGDMASAIWLDIEGLADPNPEKLNQQYVLVAGTFDAENRGHIGMFAGTLKAIFRLEKARQYRAD